MYYFMLAVATVLFASQFLFNQRFEAENGASFGSSVVFSLYSSVAGFFILFVLNGFQLQFSSFSLLMAVIHGATSFLYNIASVKSLHSVNLSAYSIFAMLGGMLLPFLYGILFGGEPLTPLKLLCCLCMATALLFTVDYKEKAGNKLWYFAVFVLNGLFGVISTIHQGNTTAVDSFSFLMLSRIAVLIFTLPFCFKEAKSFKKSVAKSLFWSAGFALFSGVGNLLVLLALKHLPASVQYPIITGGTMAVSLIISVLRKEKNNLRTVLATAVAFVSTVLIAF